MFLTWHTFFDITEPPVSIKYHVNIDIQEMYIENYMSTRLDRIPTSCL